jgi:hypothetical protein
MSFPAGPKVTAHQDSQSLLLSASGVIVSFLISLLSIAILTDRHIANFDEGMILTGAMRVASGAVPHRDFYTNYGPGQFYVLASVFWAFGPTVLVERLYDAAVKAGVVCLVYAIGFPLMGRLLGVVVAALCAHLVGRSGYGLAVYPIWPSLFFILLGVLPLFSIFDNRYSRFRLLSSGLSCGAAVLFRYDMGILAVFIVSLALALYGFASAAGGLKSIVGGIAALLCPFWCGAALIVFSLLAAYVSNGVMNDFIFQVIRFPAAYYVKTRSNPYPTPWGGLSIVYFPVFVLIVYSALKLEEFFYSDVSRSADPAKWVALTIAMFAAGLYLKGFVRISLTQMAPSIICSFILTGFMAKRFLVGRHLAIHSALPVLVLASVVYVAAFSAHEVVHWRQVPLGNLSEAWRLARRSIQQTEPSDSTTDPCDPSAEPPRARCFLAPDAEREAAQFVLSNTTPGQPIFIANGQNDKAYANNNAFYFLTGRQPASKWNQFDPGLQTSEVIQKDIVAELEGKRVATIVIDTEFDNIVEPNDSAKHSGVHILDDYIHQHYASVAEMDPYSIMQRQR